MITEDNIYVKNTDVQDTRSPQFKISIQLRKLEGASSSSSSFIAELINTIKLD